MFEDWNGDGKIDAEDEFLEYMMYDIMSFLPINFTLSEDILFLNGQALCPARDMILHGVDLYLDSLCFFFEDSQMLVISIAWPEEGIPFIKNVPLKYRWTFSDDIDTSCVYPSSLTNETIWAK